MIKSKQENVFKKNLKIKDVYFFLFVMKYSKKGFFELFFVIWIHPMVLRGMELQENEI